MLSIPGTEALSPAVKYVIAFAIIFLLLALFALVLRRLTGGRLSLPSGERGRSRQPRLGIVDVYDLDRQRQLILLRRDNVEHLLLIGGPNDVIVETNIVRTPGARLPPPPAEQAADRPEPFERAMEGHGRPLIEPQRPEPVVARLGQTEPTRAEQRNGPAGVPVEPVLKPDVVALAPAPPRPAPQPYREPPVREHPPLQAVREAPPMREPPPPPPAREPPQPAPVQRASPVKQAPPREPPPQIPEQPVLRAVPERQPAPPPPARPDATGADAAVLSNMAKQLEEALKRPLSTGRPAPGAAHPNGPAPPGEDRPSRGAPAPSGRPPQPSPAPPPAPVAAKPPEASEPPTRPRPVPVPVARIRPAPEPEAPPLPAPEPPPQRSAPEDQQSDPFSVEEIEAEFARLLGRPLDRGERPH